jgi:hypothetical protein
MFMAYCYYGFGYSPWTAYDLEVSSSRITSAETSYYMSSGMKNTYLESGIDGTVLIL